MKKVIITILIGVGSVLFGGMIIFFGVRYSENRVLLDCACGCSKYRLVINKYRDYDKWGIKGKDFHVEIFCPKCGVKVKATNVHDYFILDDIKIYWNETAEKIKTHKSEAKNL